MLSGQATLHLPAFFGHQDKFIHAGAYFVMTVLAWRCFRHIIKADIIMLLSSLGFCSLYGITDEWHQSFVIGRSSDIFDWLADTVGAALAVWLIYRYKQRQQSWPLTGLLTFF